MNLFRIIRNPYVLFLPLLHVVWNPASAQIVENDHWNLRTTVELESAYRSTETDFQKSELLVTPELNADLPLGIRLRGRGRFRADLFDELEPGQPPQFELSNPNKRTYIGNHIDVELRELFIDFFAGPVFLKAGKQQTVWGKTDGLKLLDVVNPQNFREFVLDEFEDSRIPLWSLMAEVPVGEIMVQAVWIPDKTYHKLPAEGSDFRFRAPKFSVDIDIHGQDGFEVVINPIKRPDNFIGDSDAGLRLSTFWKGWDLTLNYLYHYHDIPVVTRSIEVDPTPKVVVNQGYRRSHLTGFTFSNAFDDLTLRGETALSFDRHFRTVEQSDPDGIKKAHTLDYAIGLDWFGLDDMLISAQLFQNWTLGKKTESLFRNRVDTRLSLLMERMFMNDRLELEMLAVGRINDGFVRPKLTYQWKSNINVWLGFDGFWGDREDLIGQFDRQDRIVTGLEIGF